MDIIDFDFAIYYREQFLKMFIILMLYRFVVMEWSTLASPNLSAVVHPMFTNIPQKQCAVEGSFTHLSVTTPVVAQGEQESKVVTVKLLI